MAQHGVLLNRETFSCSICLDIPKDPVTTPCGHSYCMNCIKGYWIEDDEHKVYSCPQCRKTFTPRPVLMKNSMLADLLEEVKKKGLQAAAADHCYAGAEDVSCDVCTGRKLKAFKSCLVCLVSYCEEHLQPHYESPAFMIHKLVEPSKQLQEKTGSGHNEVKKKVCHADVGHDTVSPAAGWPESRGELEVSRLNIQKRIQCRENDDELEFYLDDMPDEVIEARAVYLKYSCDIKLDPNTAHRYIVLSQRNRKAALTNAESSFHPERFTTWTQVLSKEGLTGHCYWEVKWKGKGVRIAVAYKSISRDDKSESSGFGHNDKSWAFDCDTEGNMKYWHNRTCTVLSVRRSWSRVGVYLDHGAGILAFFSVSTSDQTLTFLFRILTKFTEPLYVGFYLSNFFDSAEFCKLK